VRLFAFLVAAIAAAAPGASATPERAQLGVRVVVAGLPGALDVVGPRSQPKRLYVVQQDGVIRVLVNGKLRAAAFLDIRSRVVSGGEQGLLSVAFHPNYARNHRIYVDYTDRNGDTRVVEYRTNGSRALPGTGRQLLFVDQPYPNHNGGQLMFGPDGYLYVGMGDGGSGGDPENRAQNLSSRLGKLLRVNVNRRGASWQVVGYGLRNPWRFSFDRSTGDLWIGDVGQNEWEEVDFTPGSSPGLENYGWRVFEGRARFEPGQEVNPAGHLVAPVQVYSHEQGCSITGGFVYRGRAIPSFRGRYIYGDFCSGRVWSLRLSGGQAAETRQEPFRISSLSSFGEDARGELYATSLEGRVYKLVG
jgi:glucose/arabinose dehydrogenase